MIPRECKRIAEVDFPIAEVSKHAAKEKSTRMPHPSQLHLWWARRPLASCRAVLMGLLLPDPCDPHCPQIFKENARKILLNHANRPTGWVKIISTDIGLRKVIIEFIADFADLKNGSNPSYLDVGRSLINATLSESTPRVLDPFAGGGSIPIEALRLGCCGLASDINPVASQILRVMIEDMPTRNSKFLEELRHISDTIEKQAKKKLTELYPQESDETYPIAYLWARTVNCESPNCGAEIPLTRSFWLCQKKKLKRALRYDITKSPDSVPNIEFEVFEPKSDKDVPLGTVTRAKATCICVVLFFPPTGSENNLENRKVGQMSSLMNKVAVLEVHA